MQHDLWVKTFHKMKRKKGTIQFRSHELGRGYATRKKEIGLKTKGGLQDHTSIRLPSSVFAWSLAQKPEGKQINILHIQVLCGVWAISEDQTAGSLTVKIWCSLKSVCGTASRRLFPPWKRVLTSGHVEWINVCVCVDTVCSWFGSLQHVGVFKCWSKGASACVYCSNSFLPTFRNSE